MRRNISIVLVVLAASGTAAVSANLMRATPLPWFRPKKVPVPIPPGLTAEVVIRHLRSGTAHFIDAREVREYAEGHLRGAVNIPASAIYENIGKLLAQVPPQEKLIVYCGGGECEASHTVADALQRDFKFEDVTIYVKGWSEIDDHKTDLFKDWIVVGGEP